MGWHSEGSSRNSPARKAEIRGIAEAHRLRESLPRNPVIVIPGVMGSRLIAGSATSVWGDFRSDYADPGSVEGARLFCIPMETGTPLERLHSSSRPAGTLGVMATSIARLPVRLKVYDDILVALGVPSYTRSHARDADGGRGGGRVVAFEFDYDWRRSLDESAVRLHEFILQATRFLRIQRGRHDAIRFDVVAHSMGGLLLRYYLRYGPRLLPMDGAPPRSDWKGADHIETAVIVGTPSAGSLAMLQRLVSGVPRNPVLPSYSPPQVGTLPSAYQLLPRTRHRPLRRADRDEPLDLLDPDTWSEMGWGLLDGTRAEDLAALVPGVDTPVGRAAVAEDHLRKCLRHARCFHAAMDREMPPRPRGLRKHLFLGDAQRTAGRAVAAPGDRAIRVVDHGPGDGTVLRSSALLDERAGEADEAAGRGRVRSPLEWDSVTLLATDHRTLLGDPIFLKNLFYLLHDAARG